ncbi:MAG: GAF domain-containing protein [Proteobacteria bacterium]|nr:GAF domain-containing protein [Pseudomonadota bacterium]
MSTQAPIAALPSAEAILAARDHLELRELVAIGALLNSERDIRRLLALILSKARALVGADAGSVYVVEPSVDGATRGRLRFEVAQNESIAVDFETTTIEITPHSLVGAAVLERRALHIPDLDAVTAEGGGPLGHDRSFDQRSGYITRSVLTVPMVNLRGEVIGVIQLINKKTKPSARLTSPADFACLVGPFDGRAIELAKTLANQAAVALDNALLYQELRQAFEGMVEAAVLAIEQRDPTTSGHSRRVADLTVGLAEQVDRLSDGPFAGVHFSRDDLKELEYAGLLHDFGKVGVPERVLVKADKLYEADRDRILDRFDYVRQWLRCESLRCELQLARGSDPASGAALAAELRRLAEELSFVDRCEQTVLAANRPTVLDGDRAELLEVIARRSYLDARGERQPYLTAAELECLGLRRGSLTPAERRQIESHVVHSYNFLCAIPWGRGFQRIPTIAAGHHEKLDGSGYPRGCHADAIPVQARMMAIVDIYDALTAADRPYKPAVPRERALAILWQDAGQGKLDSALLQVFCEAKVYAREGPVR